MEQLLWTEKEDLLGKGERDICMVQLAKINQCPIRQVSQSIHDDMLSYRWPVIVYHLGGRDKLELS